MASSTPRNIPLVTGISPKEGAPGTKVTIRGENLGKSHSDLLGVSICGVDCLLTADWISPNKILARTLLCKGRGDIIITTKSGGVGSSSVQFRGFQEIIGPSKESAVWVDETVSIGPRPLSMAAYQQEDPLQISVEGNEKKYPIEELLELFPEGSGNLRAENFVPAWFLLENHHATSFDDLKSGLHFLNRKVGSQTEGKLSFLKENMGSVMDQLDALLAVREKQERFIKMHGEGFIARVDESIAVCEREASKLFQDVLARKDRADFTRNALSGFQRFRFLFSLPGTLEKSIQKGEFENAINDYARAKALFDQPETDKPVFRKFRLETEARVQMLREKLKAKLLEKPPNIEEQKILIGHLVTLGCDSDYDPAWACLSCHYEFITNSLKNSFHQFSNDKPVKDNLFVTPSKQDNQATSPTEIQFIAVLSDIFAAYFPDFWNLGMDYFGGKLQTRPDLGRQAEMKAMMINTVHLYATLASSALLPNSNNSTEFVWNDNKSDSMNEWLPQCLNDIKDTFTELLALDPPKEMIEIIKNLLFNIRSHSLDTMLYQMSLEIADLYKQETWKSEPEENYGFITQLVSKYETLVTNSAKVIKELLLQKYSEERQLLKSEQIQKNLKEQMGSALASFSDALEMLISQNPPSSSQKSFQLNLNQSAVLNGDSSYENKPPPPSTQSSRLLLILNNCAYAKEVSLPNILGTLTKLGYPDMTSAIEKAKSGITTVEKLTFAKYTEVKYEPVVGQMEQSMYAGGFDWAKCVEVKNVRPYITKTLLGMVEVIAEVTAVSDKLISVVMSHVVEYVCDELTRLFSCVAKFNDNGSVQATLDIAAFETSVTDFLTSNSHALLKETFNLIPQSSALIRSRKVQQPLEIYKSRTKLQFHCFKIKSTTHL